MIYHLNRKLSERWAKSIVEGSYSQTWNPLAFEFRLKEIVFRPI